MEPPWDSNCGSKWQLGCTWASASAVQSQKVAWPIAKVMSPACRPHNLVGAIWLRWVLLLLFFASCLGTQISFKHKWFILQHTSKVLFQTPNGLPMSWNKVNAKCVYTDIGTMKNIWKCTKYINKIDRGCKHMSRSSRKVCTREGYRSTGKIKSTSTNPNS